MNILHLEDNDYDAQLICEALDSGGIDCQVTHVRTKAAFTEALERDDWEIILSDYSLPSYDGGSALKLATGKYPDLPFIFVAGSMREEAGIESIKNGASDYVLKHSLNRLPRAIERARSESESARAQKAAARKIKDSLREKELLLQEVHHRVNNNLQIMCSLIGMQVDAASHPVVACALRENLNRIQSMAAVHLMLGASGDLKDIDFAEYIHLLATGSFGMAPGRIRLVFNLESVRLEIERAIPCGLILNEFVSNAFKHAFPDGRTGEICVSLRQDQGSNLMTVKDSGVGLPKGRASRDAASVGLKIADTLARQLGGSIEATSGPGARFELRFAERLS
jgi:two-component sensor histidine kinase/CheY-like chemotaxis protein